MCSSWAARIRDRSAWPVCCGGPSLISSAMYCEFALEPGIRLTEEVQAAGIPFSIHIRATRVPRRHGMFTWTELSASPRLRSCFRNRSSVRRTRNCRCTTASSFTKVVARKVHSTASSSSSPRLHDHASPVTETIVTGVKILSEEGRDDSGHMKRNGVILHVVLMEWFAGRICG